SRYLLQLLRQREGIRQRPLPLVVVFFFSSRRRDTSSKRDWSSDVCSSDLLDAAWGNSHEEIYILGEWKRGRRKRHPSVISTADGLRSLSGQTGHPTPKPVGLMSSVLGMSPAGIVADPFAGSGATLIAARN